MPVNETPSQTEWTVPPGPAVKPGSVGILGNAETETAFAGFTDAVGGPNSATNGSGRPVPGTRLACTTGTGVEATGGGVEWMSVCDTVIGGAGGGACAAHAAIAQAQAAVKSVNAKTRTAYPPFPGAPAGAGGTAGAPAALGLSRYAVIGSTTVSVGVSPTP